MGSTCHTYKCSRTLKCDECGCRNDTEYGGHAPHCARMPEYRYHHLGADRRVVVD